MTERCLSFGDAICEALDICLKADPSVYTIGLGVPDPKGVFGTTAGLVDKHGANRVLDMPASENAMTGIVLGSALVGQRPVMSHQRVDFALLAMEQIVNQAANWHYMFAGQMRVPMVIRLIIGRGWGQGPQHSQSLHAWFAHVPGLRVVMPATAHDAKGLLIASIEDDNPVVFIEHRWLHRIQGPVPEGHYAVPLGRARVARAGTDVTIVSLSHMTLESLRAAETLSTLGIEVEVIDVRTLRPLDHETILESVAKTGRLLVTEPGWRFGGFGGEILSMVCERGFHNLKHPPLRLGQADCPIPSTPSLAQHCYVEAADIVNAVATALDTPTRPEPRAIPESGIPRDVPDPTFTGPF